MDFKDWYCTISEAGSQIRQNGLSNKLPSAEEMWAKAQIGQSIPNKNIVTKRQFPDFDDIGDTRTASPNPNSVSGVGVNNPSQSNVSKSDVSLASGDTGSYDPMQDIPASNTPEDYANAGPAFKRSMSEFKAGLMKQMNQKLAQEKDIIDKVIIPAVKSREPPSGSDNQKKLSAFLNMYDKAKSGQRTTVPGLVDPEPSELSKDELIKIARDNYLDLVKNSEYAKIEPVIDQKEEDLMRQMQQFKQTADPKQMVSLERPAWATGKGTPVQPRANRSLNMGKAMQDIQNFKSSS